jgi:transcriptional regulator with PAS, ATPase and Fis domain
MFKPDTNPHIVLRPAGGPEGDVAVLIFAGYALGGVPRDQPRLTVLTDEVEFGRDQNDASLLRGFDDPFMSRRHARIGRAPTGAYLVRDLDSTNGTWLDGIRIPSGAQQKLRDGSVLMMGGQVFVFRRISDDELSALREDWKTPFGPVPTLSPAMSVLTRKLRRLAPAAVDLLLTGETGVGKEVHAEAVHRASGRKGAFIAINCAAIPETLVESELFGYARGAHSTADRHKPGLLEQADGGTLFLDEIGEMSQTAQTKLLRFLQSREVLSLGSTRTRSLDVRVVAATHRTVAQENGTEGLRYDLAARLGPEPLSVPPLRDRAEDIGLLTHYLAQQPVCFVPEAYLALFLHTWKGNVRELGKVLDVARALAHDGSEVDLDHLPAQVAARVDARSTAGRPRRKRPTREELMHLLTRHGGDVARMAREIGRQRTLVWRWLREHRLRADDYRP